MAICGYDFPDGFVCMQSLGHPPLNDDCLHFHPEIVTPNETFMGDLMDAPYWLLKFEVERREEELTKEYKDAEEYHANHRG